MSSIVVKDDKIEIDINTNIKKKKEVNVKFFQSVNKISNRSDDIYHLLRQDIALTVRRTEKNVDVEVLKENNKIILKGNLYTAINLLRKFNIITDERHTQLHTIIVDNQIKEAVEKARQEGIDLSKLETINFR